MTQDSTEERRRKHMAVMDDGKDKTMTDEELIARLRDVYVDNTIRLTAADRIEALKAKLAKAVEAAFCEGFAEGYDGDWVDGDYTHAWKESEALDNLERMK